MAGGQLILPGGGRAIGPNGGRVILGDGPCECCGAVGLACFPDGRRVLSASVVLSGACYPYGTNPPFCYSGCGQRQHWDKTFFQYTGMNGAFSLTTQRTAPDTPQCSVFDRYVSLATTTEVYQFGSPQAPCSGAIIERSGICATYASAFAFYIVVDGIPKVRFGGGVGFDRWRDNLIGGGDIRCQDTYPPAPIDDFSGGWYAESVVLLADANDGLLAINSPNNLGSGATLSITVHIG